MVIDNLKQNVHAFPCLNISPCPSSEVFRTTPPPYKEIFVFRKFTSWITTYKAHLKLLHIQFTMESPERVFNKFCEASNGLEDSR